MYQTLARIIGTIILGKFVTWHWLPAAFSLTPTEVEYIGDAVLIVAMALWAFLEKWWKGQLSPITKPVLAAPNDLQVTRPATPDSTIK